MHLTSYLQNGELTIALTGEIDHHCAKNYIQTISSKIEAYVPNMCILDFEDVTFMDALRCMNRTNGELRLSGVRAQPLKVLKASGIDKIVEIMEVVH